MTSATSQNSQSKSNKRSAVSFWSKFDQTKLSHDESLNVPQILVELFPTKTLPELHRLNREFRGDINAIVQDCLHDSMSSISSHHSFQRNEAPIALPQSESTTNWFEYLAEDVLHHVFRWLRLDELGRLTLVNRESRHVAKRCFARIKEWDFTKFYQAKPRSELELASFVNAMPSLEHFALRQADLATFHHISSIVSSKKIVSLNLSGCIHLSSTDVRELVSNFVRLKTLDLSATQVDDAGLEYISEYAHASFETLIINRCHSVTDFGIKTVLLTDHFHLRHYFLRETEFTGFAWDDLTVYLETLDLHGCNSLTDFVLDASAFESNTLRINCNGCKRLRGVDITAPMLTEFHSSGCIKLLRLKIDSRSLHTLSLTQCDRLEVVDVASSTLRVIQMNGCKSIRLEDLGNGDNFMLASLAAGNLTSLDLRGMTQIPDFLIEAILDIKTRTKAGKALVFLSVTGCRSLSDEVIADVTLHFRPVRRLRKRGTPMRKLRGSILA